MLRLVLLFLIPSLGCPGMHRPPPRSAKATPQPVPTLSAPSPSPAAVVTTASPREDLLRQQEDTRSLAKGFLAQPGSRARWEELLESMDELQELGDRLFVEGDLETQNTAESVLEELAELRSEVVELEPALR